MDELKGIFIQVVADPRIHEVIDIVVVDILEAYACC